MSNAILSGLILAVSAFAIYRTYVIVTGLTKLFAYGPSNTETKRRLRLMKETEARNNESIKRWEERNEKVCEAAQRDERAECPRDGHRARIANQ